MEATVVKKVSFEAAHFLPGYQGPCANLHGHHWVIEVGVKGTVQNSGMVIDFKELKKALQPILDNFDHKCLNDVILNPTAENIAMYVRDWLLKYWIKGHTLEVRPSPEFIRVWETEDSYAEVKV